MNDTLRTISRRYSCRAYEGRLPERGKLEAIARAAVEAPSAMNRQPWRVLVVTDKALVEELDAEGMRLLAEAKERSTYDRLMGRGGTLFYGAPCLFIVAMHPGTQMDTGIVAANIALAATSLGLGSVICGLAALPFGGPKGAHFRERLGIEEGWEFGIAVLVGYAKSEGRPHEPDGTKIRWVE